MVINYIFYVLCAAVSVLYRIFTVNVCANYGFGKVFTIFLEESVTSLVNTFLLKGELNHKMFHFPSWFGVPSSSVVEL